MLWLARCSLTDLDGIGSFLALKVGLWHPGLGWAPCQALAKAPVPPQELYVSYNNVSDLSPLCLLEQLEVLDLEGNSVEDLGQVCYLRLCPKLATLSLEGNPVCLRSSPSNKVGMVGTQTAGCQRSGAPMVQGPPAPCGLFTMSLFSCVAGGLAAASASSWARTKPHRAMCAGHLHIESYTHTQASSRGTPPLQACAHPQLHMSCTCAHWSSHHLPCQLLLWPTGPELELRAAPQARGHHWTLAVTCPVRSRG